MLQYNMVWAFPLQSLFLARIGILLVRRNADPCVVLQIPFPPITARSPHQTGYFACGQCEVPCDSRQGASSARGMVDDSA